MAEQTAQELRTKRKALIDEVLQSPLHGKRIYLLGSAEFGPTNEPILIKSTVGLHNTFGKQGTLIDAFHAIKYTSKDNLVYLVKTTGEHAVAHLNVNIQDGEIIEDGFTLVSSQSNELFNDIEFLVDIDAITIIFPNELGLKNKVYKYQDYPTIDKLATAINKETKHKNSYVYAYYSVDPATPTQHAFFVCNPTSVYMYGGQCGLHYSKNLLYNCLNNTYEVLESHDIDIVIPVDAFMDDIYPDDAEGTQYQYNMKYYQSTKDYLTEDFTGKKLSFMDQLLQFCIKQLNFGMVTTGIIGYNSSYKYWSKYLAEADDIALMYKHCYEYNMVNCDNPFYAFLISVVAGDIRYNRGTIIDNGYLAYAALCSKTVVTNGTTNIPISDTISLHHEFSEHILKDLADTGIVTFRQSPLYKTPVVYDGITASPENENLKLYCNVRMIQMCMSYVNKLFQHYVGYNMIDLIEDEIVVEDLHHILKLLNVKGVITSYEFNIVPYYAKGEIKVYLNLMTCYMVKAIQLCSVINVELAEEE
jgi:hypothetical protein